MASRSLTGADSSTSLRGNRPRGLANRRARLSCRVNLVIILPAVLLIVLVMIAFYRRRGRGGTGLGDRNDSNERPELTGEAQWKSRHEGPLGGTRP